ncbi:phosphoacetylglucosamine mutase isoform X1 [Lutzomyia longipalpis]|uniref:phosphoacetylglucosamine mutase isoform X1 n=1 Tax=Lutzomyia longipalpis TaxID=7200 RepID=UPI002483FA72|nr:phosphoacetylglucosamine mutase isoform X1 [Lutzomyia longipalpis]
MSVNLRTVYAFAREMYPKKVKGDIQYGTAGFRTKAENLDYVMYRMGLLATLRSRLKDGAVIGVMITASHNPEPDNGVKLVDPLGEMLEARWEKLATRLVNVSDQELESEIAAVIREENVCISAKSTVFVGMDNRYHSPRLLKAVCDGVVALKGSVKDFGILTTPMLHYLVVAANTRGGYGVPTEEGYYKKIITAFQNIRGTTYTRGNYTNRVYFDGANGVGARKMLQFLKRMDSGLDVVVFNSGEGKINHECGADYVKVQQKAPAGMPEIEANGRCVSVDGDADRVVYFFTDENNCFHLLDGDRIATLVADYLMELVRACNINLRMGLVQTAYANGASTDYIEHQLRVPVACVPTGVKHLHHKALEYDIGVYFEANGHGTVIFSQNAKEIIKKAAEDEKLVNFSSIFKVFSLKNFFFCSLNEEQRSAAKTFLQIIDLINETVGDAISDMLLVETVLLAKGWCLKDWVNTYADLPNLQLKVSVADRNVITTTDAERICVTPEGLQEEINSLVAKYPRARAFVRPSGTEDVVRVYAEAESKEDTAVLAHEVAAAVHRLAGGVGNSPEIPRQFLNSHY